MENQQSIDLSEHKRRVAGVYNLAAPGYDKPAVRFFPVVAARLVELMQLQPGETALDIATGTGAAALVAAGAVGKTGRVVGVDIALDMLDQARRSIETSGLANIELQEGDAEHLNFPDDTFDAVLCASSIFFLPDMGTGPREWARVTRPGGRVGFSGYGESAFQPISDLFEARIRSYGVTLAAPQKPFSWQRLTDPEQCRDLLRGAGLENIEVRSEQLGYFLDSPADWWDIVWNSGFRGPVSQLSAEALDSFKKEHLAEVEELATEQGIWLDIAALFATGNKPSKAG